MSEERVLKLRDENLALKRTVRDQELQLKKLQTKLIRTEAASRKAVRKIGSGPFASNAATDLQSKLLQTELRVGELEEKVEEQPGAEGAVVSSPPSSSSALPPSSTS